MKKVTNQYVLNPHLAAINVEIWRDIKSMRSPMISCVRSCHNLCNCVFNSPVFRDGCSCLPRMSQTCCMGGRSGNLVAIEAHHILNDIVGRVAQYVDGHCLVDE
ncbi:hypothetical protein TNCV_1036801 [Trichonephila clavipes]|nr:hypothetical protein TNCV_1036801 [Trichonephila clavipes]